MEEYKNTPAVKCFNWVWLDKSVKFGTQVAHGIYFQLMLVTHWYLNGNNLKYWFEISDIFSSLKRCLGHRAVSNLKRRVRQGSLASCVRVLSSHNSIQNNWNRASFDFFVIFDYTCGSFVFLLFCFFYAFELVHAWI